jgi:hypothetical protein
MFSIRPLTRDEMLQNWARVQAAKPPPKPEPRPLNLQHVLDLGNMIVFLFRGRPYAMPPVPLKPGLQIMDAWLQLRQAGAMVTAENLGEYSDLLGRLERLLSRRVFPIRKGLIRITRLLHRLRLLPNPLRGATEADIVELALFVLGRRTMSSGALNLTSPNQGRGTSWMN